MERVHPLPPQLDFSERPFIAIWEVTQACDLVCLHCRACAQPARSPEELTTTEAERLIDQIADLRVPVFVITGGDPLKRPDIFKLVAYATERGVRTSLSPSVTLLLTQEAIAELRRHGLARLALSLDGSTAEIHDAFRGVRGSYERTLLALGWAREMGLAIQINTTITRHNLTDVDNIAPLVESRGCVLWSVFFLVPTGRARLGDLISAEEFEVVFEKLYQTARRGQFDIKTTEAPHYRRYVLQRRTAERRHNPRTRMAMAGVTGGDGIGRAPQGLNDAKGFVFISHIGEVHPSGFLPLSAGNVRSQPLADIYRNSPLFRALRDTSRLEGKCGECEFREVCGGSRARAYATTGNPFAEEPCCIYEPRSVRPDSELLPA